MTSNRWFGENVRFRDVGIELDGMMVRKLTCKTRDTSHETQTSTEVSQRKRVKIAEVAGASGGNARIIRSAGHSGRDTPDTPVSGCSRQFVFLAEIRALDLKFVGIWLELGQGNAN